MIFIIIILSFKLNMSAKNLYLLCSLLILNLTPKNFLVGNEVGLIFHGGYTFSSFENQKSTAIYLSIINNSQKAIDIISLNTGVAKKSEIHNIIEEGNIVKMKKINKLTIKKGETVFFQPGGKHIMLFGLNKRLKDKEKFLIFFETSEKKNIKAEITVIDRTQ